MFGRRGRSAPVARDDGSVSLSVTLDCQEGFDSRSYRGGPALVDAGCDEHVELSQELLREPDCDLLGCHEKGIPEWDVFWYSIRLTAIA